ncbi:MAG: ferrous iron transport protein B [PVC group bacterium]|nr:ferrous iron transport protein B [PVC group bacterium]
MAKKITIALAGNPNSGKTTVFNNLTGQHRHIGNYPGVTVEKIEGRLNYNGYQIRVIDLPGTYSLTAHSIDEIIARNFVLEEKPDVVINIIDASNLERNLYLTTQFMELGVPLVLVLNMYDVAQKHGVTVNEQRFSELLGNPVVFSVATKKERMHAFLDAAIDLVEGKNIFAKTSIGYGADIQAELKKIEDVLVQDKLILEKYPSSWLAIKLLEKDDEVLRKIKKSKYADEVLEQSEQSIQYLEGIFNDTPEAIIADGRYGFISGACSEAVGLNYELRHSVSDKIDGFLINKFLGLPIFLGLMWIVFKLTFTVSIPLMNLIESGVGGVAALVGSLFPAETALKSLIVDGVISGVGSVLVFLPIILIVFLAMAFLEGSGYMARAAFIMDRLMHKIGLHGRSFIPMLLGFGCNVPAIMAARSIEDKKDRMVTILVNSFMSCGARLPVYALFIAAFFPQDMAGNVLFSLYLLGMLVAVLIAKLFRKYLFRGEAAPFVMELPPYRMPTVKSILIHMWDKAAMYLKKAGTIIFAGCVIVWFLSNYPQDVSYSRNYDALLQSQKGYIEQIVELEKQREAEKLKKSYAGSLGRLTVPIFRPLGFGDWRLSVALISGIVGKEIVVGTLGTLYAVGDDSAALGRALRNIERTDGSKLFTPLVAYSFMVFVLLYIPCMATIAVIKQETNSWLWALFAVFYTTGVAWVASFVIYQGGRLIGFQ